MFLFQEFAPETESIMNFIEVKMIPKKPVNACRYEIMTVRNAKDFPCGITLQNSRGQLINEENPKDVDPYINYEKKNSCKFYCRNLYYSYLQSP